MALGPDADLSTVGRLAAALYTAACDFSQYGRFSPGEWPIGKWRLFAGRVRTYRANLPEKGLSRGEYEALRKSRQPA
jgi:hypothetical protein